jgi:hypothetical protein
VEVRVEVRVEVKVEEEDILDIRKNIRGVREEE